MIIARKITKTQDFQYDLFAIWDEQLFEWRFVAHHVGTNNYYEAGMDSKGMVIINTGRGARDEPHRARSWKLPDNAAVNLMWLQKLEENVRFGLEPIPPLDYGDLKIEVWG